MAAIVAYMKFADSAHFLQDTFRGHQDLQKRHLMTFGSAKESVSVRCNSNFVCYALTQEN